MKITFPRNKVQQLDLLNLSQNVKQKSQDMILINSVLDTLTRPEVEKALKEIYSCLKPGGVMIHFAPRTTFPSSTTHQYASEKLVVFPVIDQERNCLELK